MIWTKKNHFCQLGATDIFLVMVVNVVGDPLDEIGLVLKIDHIMASRAPVIPDIGFKSFDGMKPPFE